jgi:Undecaprenyl-phosphate galactose phosphotransferase WbaP
MSEVVLKAAPALFNFSGRQAYMFSVLMISDGLALLTSVALGVGFKLLTDSRAEVSSYMNVWPLLFLFLAFYYAVGLYSGTALSPPEELKIATFSSAFLFLSLSALRIASKNASLYFSWALCLALVASVVLVPLFRALCRMLFGNKAWWGYPTVAFSSGGTARFVVETLLRSPGFGLKLVAIFDDQNTGWSGFNQVPIIHDSSLVGQIASSLRCPYAVIALPANNSEGLIEAIEDHISPYFARILIIPDILKSTSTSVRCRTVGDLLGLEVLEQTALPDRRFSKRMLDLTISVLALVALAPLLAAIALAIQLDSEGGVFYGHRRIGRNGKPFRAWKFRTMVSNSSEVLERYLTAHPELRREWETSQKLRNDPRVTRLGRFLRKMSLDELPQIWNVLVNEMSLVGPRPIVEAEVPKYGKSYLSYLRVKGGITGLWQVSGRNDVSYETRVRLDSFYVRNWSVWLDLCILYRTIGTVLFGSGAY